MNRRELLDTDRVNFLIWRYLIEGNYRQTALRFQQEWQIEAPHRHFDFAPQVENYALVSVLMKGLNYEALERDHARSQVLGDATATADVSQFGVFGPLIAHPSLDDMDLDDDDDDGDNEPEAQPEPAQDAENSRKRQVDSQHQLANGNTAKRPKLSNANTNGHGFENGAERATSPMEVADQHHPDNNNNNNINSSSNNNNNNNSHAYPSPLEGEPEAQTPIPRTEGPEQGTQTDRVVNLSSDTTYLGLGTQEESSTPATAGTGSSAAVETPQHPVILHCEWNPKEPARLAAGGTDALARIWTVPRATGSNPVQCPVENLTDDSFSPKTKVTAMKWAPDGLSLAIATEVAESGPPRTGRIDFWSADGSHMQRFDVADPPVLKLVWNPFNQALLSIGPDKEGTVITVFPVATTNTISYFLEDHNLDAHPESDIAWMSETEFVLSGGEKLLGFRCTGELIELAQEFKTRQHDTPEEQQIKHYEQEDRPDEFTQVQFDRHAGLVAAASSKGYIDIWDASSGELRSIFAHDGAITSIRWQPTQSDHPGSERLLASGGEDGIIYIWNVLSSDRKPKFSMTMENCPVVALAFSPDGALIAGATTDSILIWKVGEYAFPQATWYRIPHEGYKSPDFIGQPDEEPLNEEHSLSWDADGRKLAFAVNNRLAVINYR